MKSIAKTAASFAIAAALIAPSGAIADPPSHAKAHGKRCQGQSKVKDPVTKMSPFKACIKNKGAVTPVVEPTPPGDGTTDGGDGTTNTGDGTSTTP